MWARWCWYLGHDNRPCPSSSREPWSVPRLRGRGKQGEIARKAHLCPRSMTSTRGSLSSTYVLNTRKSADRTLGLPRVYLCSPRPRKRGTLHICANLSSFRDSLPFAATIPPPPPTVGPRNSDSAPRSRVPALTGKVGLQAAK